MEKKTGLVYNNTKMIKTTSLKNKKYRLFILMLPLVIPGLIISGFGFHSISQQEKAKELKIEENHTADLQLIRKEVEEEIQSHLERVFQQLLKSKIQLNQPDSIQQVLKEIILKNSIVKYPFLIDASSNFIFPFSKKSILPVVEPSFPGIRNKKNRDLFRQGEQLEFRDRKIGGALKYYVKSLETNDEESLKPYIFNAIARCYFKLGRYPQAMSYYYSILGLFSRILPSKRDYSLYFQVLRQMALSHQRLGRKDRAMRRYLRLYDEILQYETSVSGDTFAFFKNEALEYLNQYINTNPQTKDNVKQKAQLKSSGTSGRL